jgi:hypothetical protein
MKKLLCAMAAIAAVGVAQAAPTVISVDDFNSPDVLIQDALGGGPTTVIDSVRTASYELLSGPDSGDGSTLRIGSQTFPVGLLEVANASGRDSRATISWAIAAGLIPGDAINVGFFLEVVQSDGNPTSVDFVLDGSALAAFSIPPNTMDLGLSFGLSAAQLASLANGGTLAMTLNGNTGWDLTVDLFGFSYDRQQAIPEPGSVALAGLALVGLAAARRRKA